MKPWLERLLHRHTYIKIGFREESDRFYRYSMRQYKCSDCGKERWVDGRADPYDK